MKLLKLLALAISVHVLCAFFLLGSDALGQPERSCSACVLPAPALGLENPPAGDDSSHHYLVGPRAELKSGGLEIATINSHHSGVPEVAWLVKVDGIVLYHNGDCQPADPRAEHVFLKTKADNG